MRDRCGRPPPPPPPRCGETEAELRTRGCRSFDAGNFKAAAKAFQMVLERGCTTFDVHFNAASAWYRLAMQSDLAFLEPALHHLDLAVKIPGARCKAVAHFLRGVCLFQRSEYRASFSAFSDSLAALEGATSLDCRSAGLDLTLCAAELHFNMGLCNYAAGSVGAAKVKFRTASKAWRDCKDPRMMEVMNGRYRLDMLFELPVGCIFRHQRTSGMGHVGPRGDGHVVAKGKHQNGDRNGGGGSTSRSTSTSTHGQRTPPREQKGNPDVPTLEGAAVRVSPSMELLTPASMKGGERGGETPGLEEGEIEEMAPLKGLALEEDVRPVGLGCRLMDKLVAAAEESGHEKDLESGAAAGEGARSALLEEPRPDASPEKNGMEEQTFDIEFLLKPTESVAPLSAEHPVAEAAGHGGLLPEVPCDGNETDAMVKDETVQDIDVNVLRPIRYATRQALCEHCPYFKSYQGGLYTSNNKIYGLLLGAYHDDGDGFSVERIITNVGGGRMAADDGSEHVRTHPQEEADRRVVAARRTIRDGSPIFVVMHEDYANGMNVRNIVWTQPYIAVGWYHIVDLVPPSGHRLSFSIVLERARDPNQPGSWHVLTHPDTRLELPPKPGLAFPAGGVGARWGCTRGPIPDHGLFTLWMDDNPVAFEDPTPVWCSACGVVSMRVRWREWQCVECKATKSFERHVGLPPPRVQTQDVCVPDATCVSMVRTRDLFAGTPFAGHMVHVYFLPQGGKVYHIRSVASRQTTEHERFADECFERLCESECDLSRGVHRRLPVKESVSNQFLAQYFFAKETRRVEGGAGPGGKVEGDDKGERKRKLVDMDGDGAGVTAEVPISAKPESRKQRKNGKKVADVPSAHGNDPNSILSVPNDVGGTGAGWPVTAATEIAEKLPKKSKMKGTKVVDGSVVLSNDPKAAQLRGLGRATRIAIYRAPAVAAKKWTKKSTPATPPSAADVAAQKRTKLSAPATRPSTPFSTIALSDPVKTVKSTRKRKATFKKAELDAEGGPAEEEEPKPKRKYTKKKIKTETEADVAESPTKISECSVQTAPEVMTSGDQSGPNIKADIGNASTSCMVPATPCKKAELDAQSGAAADEKPKPKRKYTKKKIKTEAEATVAESPAKVPECLSKTAPEVTTNSYQSGPSMKPDLHNASTSCMMQATGKNASEKFELAGSKTLVADGKPASNAESNAAQPPSRTKSTPCSEPDLASKEPVKFKLTPHGNGFMPHFKKVLSYRFHRNQNGSALPVMQPTSSDPRFDAEMSDIADEKDWKRLNPGSEVPSKFVFANRKGTKLKLSKTGGTIQTASSVCAEPKASGDSTKAEPSNEMSTAQGASSKGAACEDAITLLECYGSETDVEPAPTKNVKTELPPSLHQVAVNRCRGPEMEGSLEFAPSTEHWQGSRSGDARPDFAGKVTKKLEITDGQATAPTPIQLSNNFAAALPPTPHHWPSVFSEIPAIQAAIAALASGGGGPASALHSLLPLLPSIQANQAFSAAFGIPPNAADSMLAPTINFLSALFSATQALQVPSPALTVPPAARKAAPKRKKPFGENKPPKPTSKKSADVDEYEFHLKINEARDISKANEGARKAAELLHQLCPEANFNHILLLGYLKGQGMNFHTDDEPNLKTPVATMSLGNSATMTFRLRRSGKSRKVKEALPPRPLFLDESNKPFSDRTCVIPCPLEPLDVDPEAFSQAATFKILMQHGDVVMMDGDSVQKYYEHEIDNIGGVRYAITMRRLFPSSLLSLSEKLAREQATTADTQNKVN
ncbi:hypothetical protein HDU96_010722 [Phlyctochytrium bullatum]|nr:hypothetical protein HDU96_010722 [Phlyctochytrium bullatum]